MYFIKKIKNLNSYLFKKNRKKKYKVQFRIRIPEDRILIEIKKNYFL